MTIADVVVVGSGAAGMTSAITAACFGCRVVVVEKAHHIGGVTAWSGGAAWLPLNPHMRNAGVIDSPDAVVKYIRQLTGNRFDPTMVNAFVNNAAGMVSFLESQTSAMRFQSYLGPDYHPELEGAAPKARTLMPLPFDGRSLGPMLKRMRGPMRELTVFNGMQVDPSEALHLQYSWKRRKSFRIAAPLVVRYALDRLRFGRSTRLIRGQALTARLLKSALDLGVEFLTDTTAERLLEHGGRIAGLVVKTKGVQTSLEAQRGVVLATGGFSANPELVARYFPNAAKHIVMLPETNRGEGLMMAQAAGAALGADNADNAIWMPASTHRRRDNTIARYPHFAFDRCKPGSMMVNPNGQRFVNEAASYHAVVRAMGAAGAIPAWLIADHYFLRKYGMGIARPFPYPYRRLLSEGYLLQGKTIAELAQKLGVDPDALQASVQRLNGFARTGEDADFGRGGDIFTRTLGDAEHKPNPCLGSIRVPPFYALALYPSDCGTTLGLSTNENAQVLRLNGKPMEGLYACGLDMNSVMRGNYPGAGTMIGPAMTFGYLAARHMLGKLAGENPIP